MVCIQCGGNTHVTNSRLQRRNNQVWRRRQCKVCQAIFTTEEAVALDLSWVVTGASGTFAPFSRDKLFISIHASLQHRQQPIQDATALTTTIINKLPDYLRDTTITTQSIKQVVLVALTRLDKAAGSHYAAFHP